MLESAMTWLQHADPSAVYVFLFLTAFLENVIPPIPGDVPIAFIGYLISKSAINFWGAVFSSSLGSTAGFMLVYLISKHLGVKLYAEGDTAVRHRFSKGVHRFFPPSDMVLLRRKFATHGYLAVLVNRFLFGSRAVISVMAGLMHLKTHFVLLAAITSAVVWNILLLSGGFLLGANWQSIGGYVVMYSIPVTAVFVLVLFFSAWKFFRERKRKHE